MTSHLTPEPPNKIGRANRRPASPLDAGRELGRALHAPPSLSAAVDAAARGLRCRDFLFAGLIGPGERLFPDNWIQVPAPDVRVGRVQNFSNWRPDPVPQPGVTCPGPEYFATSTSRFGMRQAASRWRWQSPKQAGWA